MSVSEILAQKGSDVVTVDVQWTVEDVVKCLAENKIGAAVVLDERDAVCGIVSERDIIRRIGVDGCDILKDSVSQCMTHKVVACDRSATIDEVMEKMTTGRFRHLPVLENGKLVGLVSIGDVVKRKIEQAERDADELKRYIAG